MNTTGKTAVPVIDRRKVLYGHTSPETAFVVDDYPYGYRLRCTIRYWVESRKRFGQRFVSQTTNPTVAGERWNNPKPGQYGLRVWLYEEKSTGHIKHSKVSQYGISPEYDARIHLSGMFDGFTDEDKEWYARAREASMRYADPWQRFAETIAILRAHVVEHGALPDVGQVVPYGSATITLPDGATRYIEQWDVTAAAAMADHFTPAVAGV